MCKYECLKAQQDVKRNEFVFHSTGLIFLLPQSLKLRCFESILPTCWQAVDAIKS